jgi:hypothetical protein
VAISSSSNSCLERSNYLVSANSSSPSAVMDLNLLTSLMHLGTLDEDRSLGITTQRTSVTGLRLLGMSSTILAGRTT